MRPLHVVATIIGAFVAIIIIAALLVSWAPADFPISFLDGNRVYLLRTPSDTPDVLAKGTAAALSPDGEKLAFTTAGISRHPYYSLDIIDLGGGENEGELFRTLVEITDLSWGPQSQRVAFILKGKSTKGAVTKKLAVSDILDPRITILVSVGESIAGEPIDQISAPTWGPDFTSLYFHNGAFLMRLGLDRELKEKTALDELLGEGLSVSEKNSFAPSPVKEGMIAFSATRDNSGGAGPASQRIYLYNGESGQPRPLSPEDIEAIHPTWSPGGQYIYFTGVPRETIGGKRDPHVFQIRIDGSNLIRLSRGVRPSVGAPVRSTGPN